MKRKRKELFMKKFICILVIASTLAGALVGCASDDATQKITDIKNDILENFENDSGKKDEDQENEVNEFFPEKAPSGFFDGEISCVGAYTAGSTLSYEDAVAAREIFSDLMWKKAYHDCDCSPTDTSMVVHVGENSIYVGDGYHSVYSPTLGYLQMTDEDRARFVNVFDKYFYRSGFVAYFEPSNSRVNLSSEDDQLIRSFISDERLVTGLVTCTNHLYSLSDKDFFCLYFCACGIISTNAKKSYLLTRDECERVLDMLSSYFTEDEKLYLSTFTLNGRSAPYSDESDRTFILNTIKKAHWARAENSVSGFDICFSFPQNRGRSIKVSYSFEGIMCLDDRTVCALLSEEERDEMNAILSRILDKKISPFGGKTTFTNTSANTWQTLSDEDTSLLCDTLNSLTWNHGRPYSTGIPEYSFSFSKGRKITVTRSGLIIDNTNSVYSRLFGEDYAVFHAILENYLSEVPTPSISVTDTIVTSSKIAPLTEEDARYVFDIFINSTPSYEKPSSDCAFRYSMKLDSREIKFCTCGKFMIVNTNCVLSTDKDGAKRVAQIFMDTSNKFSITYSGSVTVKELSSGMEWRLGDTDASRVKKIINIAAREHGDADPDTFEYRIKIGKEILYYSLGGKIYCQSRGLFLALNSGKIEELDTFLVKLFAENN